MFGRQINDYSSGEDDMQRNQELLGQLEKTKQFKGGDRDDEEDEDEIDAALQKIKQDKKQSQQMSLENPHHYNEHPNHHPHCQCQYNFYSLR